jgi:starch phosphorylase
LLPHGEVSRRLLGVYFPGLPENEVPVGHVTNGAHTRSSVSRDMAGLFDRYLVSDWSRRPGVAETWEGIDTIPDEELWATHERRRERLVVFARRRLARQLEQRGASARDIDWARGVLNTRASPSGSPAASPRTSGPTSSCTTSTGSRPSCWRPSGPCR